MADPVLHLGGSLTRFTWEWREHSTNVWVLDVTEAGGEAVGGAVVLELDDGQELVGEVVTDTTGTQVSWRVNAEDGVAPPRTYIGAAIVNRQLLSDGSTFRDVWARGILYTV